MNKQGDIINEIIGHYSGDTVKYDLLMVPKDFKIQLKA